MELVDRLGGSVGPGGLTRFTDFDIVQIVGVSIVAGTGKVYGRNTASACNERPDLTALSGVQRSGGAVDIGVMGLIPQHGVSRGEVRAGIIRDRVAAVFAGDRILDAPVGAGVGYVEQLGVHAVRAVDTAGVQNLAVCVDFLIGMSFLNFNKSVCPEIRLQAADIVGSLDMLRGVETETVSACLDQLFHVIIDR